MISTVLFDLDGTLIDSNPIIIEAWQRCTIKYGVSLTQRDIEYHIIGVSAKHTLAKLFGHFTPEQQEKIHQEVDDFEELAPTQMLLGAKDFLLTLKNCGIRIGMVTSSWQAKIQHVIASHEIELFDHIICRTDVQHGKPDPEGYIKALQLFGIKSQEALVFEDSIGGIQAAKNAQLHCIAINQNYYTDLPCIKDYTQLGIDNGKVVYSLADGHYLSINCS